VWYLLRNLHSRMCYIYLGDRSRVYAVANMAFETMAGATPPTRNSVVGISHIAECLVRLVAPNMSVTGRRV